MNALRLSSTSVCGGWCGVVVLVLAVCARGGGEGGMCTWAGAGVSALPLMPEAVRPLICTQLLALFIVRGPSRIAGRDAPGVVAICMIVFTRPCQPPLLSARLFRKSVAYARALSETCWYSPLAM